jgi:UDP-3-O-[3-hydroxymyristoyl] glucosamine N-acyltransferase
VKTVRLKEIGDLVQGKVVGDPAITITGVQGIREAQPGEITFLSNPRYRPDLEKTAASAVVVAKGLEGLSIPMVIVENPYYAFAQIVKFFHAQPYRPLGVSERAVIGARVMMGKDARSIRWRSSETERGSRSGHDISRLLYRCGGRGRERLIDLSQRDDS